MRLKDIGEDALVRLIAREYSLPHPRLLKAIGDDTSVTRVRRDRALLATTDILIEGTHFKRNYTPPYFLGRKLLGISLSDIAAMGGEPFFFLTSIALPPGTQLGFLKEIYRGIRETAERFGCALAGGNTSRSSKVILSLTLFGEARERLVVYRSGAREGDDLFVTGNLGGSALGLRVLAGKGLRSALRGPFREAALRHLAPEPRVAEGRLLSRERLVTAMIDISDGLLLDLQRLCGESRVGALVELEKVPVSGGLERYIGKEKPGKEKAVETALTGGEDYELLFTSPPGREKRITSLLGRLGTGVTRVGKIVARKEGIRIMDWRGRAVKFRKAGFRHF